jgi:hypothetical protein
VTFVRWYDDDIETIVPPLFAKSRRRPSTRDGGDTNGTEPAPADGTTPAGGTAPGGATQPEPS